MDELIFSDEFGLTVLGCSVDNDATSLALSFMLTSINKKVCYISLVYNDADIILALLCCGYYAKKGIKYNRYKEGCETYYHKCATITEIMELIVLKKNDFDYFVIDKLTGVGEGLKPLFSKNKDYQDALRNLKSIALAIEKNIIVLAKIHKKVKTVINWRNKNHFYKLGLLEKYIDNLIILYRPRYYYCNVRAYIDPYGSKCEKSDVFLYFIKTGRGQSYSVKLEDIYMQDQFYEEPIVH